MIIELIIDVLIGVLLGTITGLPPGIHINLISALVVAFSAKLLGYFQPIYIATALVSMAITHTFLDVLPTTFLGVADSENAISTLPSHKLLLEGKAKESIILALVGSFLGLISIIIVSPIILNLIPKFYDLIKDHVAKILIILSAIIIYQSKDKKLALTIFVLSGVLGILTFSLKTLTQPLFPMLSGLFGISALIIGMKNKITIPKQKENIKINIKKSSLLKNLSSSILASLFTSFLPGLTSSHTTAVASAINKIEDNKDYIIINNSITTISMFLSVVALYSIEKARNGVIVALSNIITISKMHIFFFASVALVAAFVSIFLTLKITSLFIKIFPKLNYRILCLLIISFICMLTSYISGFLGILVLFVSTLIGIAALLLDIERTHLMGVLILPIIFYFML